MSRLHTFCGRFVWCIPALIVAIGIFYFINLFDRIYSRDLNRQLDEKYQLVNLIEALHSNEGMTKVVEIMDGFTDTYVYLLEVEDSRVIEDFHTVNCPYRFEKHPFEITEIKNKIKKNKRGAFATVVQNTGKIYWEYRWINIQDKNYLLLMGISNYPTDVLDKELQISIGTLLLITALLNWVLVGYAKYLRAGCCKIKRKN